MAELNAKWVRERWHIGGYFIWEVLFVEYACIIPAGAVYNYTREDAVRIAAARARECMAREAA